MNIDFHVSVVHTFDPIITQALEKLMTQNDRIITDVASFKTALTAHATKVQKQLQQVKDLILAQGQPSPEVDAALADLEAGIAQLGGLDTELDADDSPDPAPAT